MFNQAREHRFYDVIRPRGIFGELRKNWHSRTVVYFIARYSTGLESRLTTQLKQALYNYVIKEGIP